MQITSPSAGGYTALRLYATPRPSCQNPAFSSLLVMRSLRMIFITEPDVIRYRMKKITEIQDSLLAKQQQKKRSSANLHREK